MTVQRVLRDTQAQPEVEFFVGTTSTAASGAVTVDILRGDGSIFATDATTAHGAAGLYTYTLAPQADLELFTLQWEGTFSSVVQRVTTQVEVVGGYYVSLADIRALQGLADTVAFPNEKLAESRQWFEDLAEDHCGVAFVPRYRRDVLNGTGSGKIELSRWHPRRLLSVIVNGVAQTGLTTWDLYDHGVVVRDGGSFPWGYNNIEITYEHGLDAPDSQMRQAALTAIRDNALGLASGIPPQATEVRQEFTTISLSIPGPDAPTGIPSVDRVLNAQQVPKVAVA